MEKGFRTNILVKKYKNIYNFNV